MVDVFSLISPVRVHHLRLYASTIRLQSRISKIGSVKSLRIPRGVRMQKIKKSVFLSGF